MKKITGTWFEFQHHSKAEGVYWNPQCQEFSDEQWRAKVKEISELGMDYICLLATALDFEAYFDTDIFKKAKLACDDPIEALLSQADTENISVMLSAGFYGNWLHPDINQKSKTVTKRALTAMNELCEKYGHHKSMQGWYLPDEEGINPYYPQRFIDYVNTYSAEAHRLNRDYKVVIGPYGTRLLKADDRFVSQLEQLDVDYVAYQDEVGVQKSSVDETAAFYEALKKAHDKAGRSKLWADIELFDFEGEVYKSPLIPAPFERIKKQIEAVSDYVEKILCYQYQGLMSKPNSIAPTAGKEAEKLYCDYTSWLKQLELV